MKLNKIRSFIYDFLSDRNISRGKMAVYVFLKSIRRDGLYGLLYFIIGYFYSYYLTIRLFRRGFLPRVMFDGKPFRVKINISRYGKVLSKSKTVFVFKRYMDESNSAKIEVMSGAVLEINRPVSLGNGVKIIVNRNAKLSFGGSNFSSSGITSNSMIIAFSQVVIGEDTIISWGVLICDSSQHKINGTVKIGAIKISDNVWISEGVTIAPFSTIGKMSIVGSKSYVNGNFDPNSLITGVPAVFKKKIVSWEI